MAPTNNLPGGGSPFDEGSGSDRYPDRRGNSGLSAVALDVFDFIEAELGIVQTSAPVASDPIPFRKLRGTVWLLRTIFHAVSEQPENHRGGDRRPTRFLFDGRVRFCPPPFSGPSLTLHPAPGLAHGAE